MPLELAEVEHSRASFEARIAVEVPATRLALAAFDDKYRKCYASVVSIEAWRAYVFEGRIDAGALEFFVEAQNDLLTSYCLARVGSWRSALMSLRSSLENALLCAYFKDHLVELSRWPELRPKGFKELLSYFEAHFPYSGPSNVHPYVALTGEYAELSRAVHGSSRSFRMTRDMAIPAIWSADQASCGMWATRFVRVVRSLNLMLMHVMVGELTGAKNRSLREAIAISGLPRAAVRNAWAINLPAT